MMDTKGGAVCPPEVVADLNRWIASGCPQIMTVKVAVKQIEDIPAPVAKPVRGDGMRMINRLVK